MVAWCEARLDKPVLVPVLPPHGKSPVLGELRILHLEERRVAVLTVLGRIDQVSPKLKIMKKLKASG